VCSTHLEAGHDWNEDCPAKRNSARCVRACVGRLQQWFGCNTHIVVGGDFNAQKTQLHRRLLTGEGAGIFRNMKLDDPTVAARIGDGASQKTKPGYEASAPGAAIGNGGPNDPNVDSSDDESNSNGDTNDWSPPSGHKSWDNRWDLVDVFDALKEDNPCSSVGDALDHGVLSGGHRGTTWHNWRGPDWACMISSIMAKSGKHHSQLTFAHGGEREKNTGKTRGPPKSSDGAVQHGGGFSGSIGGLGTEAEPDTRAVGAVGNQRHIDHIYVARGDGIRDTSRLDKQPRVRVVRARVVTNSASEDVRVSGEARCACGFAASARRDGCPVFGADAVEEFTQQSLAAASGKSKTGKTGKRRRSLLKCVCSRTGGVWASDHFPVVSDLRVSWRDADGEPRTRRTQRDRAHSPDRAE
tara:strand:+ start:367 stop:1599 length:1233 start_codon:yes stop_codon:yes gene_type:complete